MLLTDIEIEAGREISKSLLNLFHFSVPRAVE